MSSFSVTGLSSGLDYGALIDAIVGIERQSIYRLEAKQYNYNDKISVFNSLSSKLSIFKSASETLKDTTTFYKLKATSGDTDVFSVSASGSASPGSYSITEITQLAQNEKQVHTSGVADKAASLTASDVVFEYTYGTASPTTRTLTVTADTTLEGLRDLINDDADNPGVTATILNDGTNYHLVLTGKDSGDDYDIAITANTTLTGFASADFTEQSNAQDAAFKIDGVAMTRTSNTVSDAIEGVTITLKQTSTPGATLTVENDTAAVKSNIEAFVNAYNAVVSYVDLKSEYNVDTKKGGALTGDSTSRGIMNSLRLKLTKGVSGLPDDMLMLAQIGITTDYVTGKLTIDSAVLDDKLATDPEGVFNIFGDSSDGIAVNIYNYLDELTDSDEGVIAYKKTSLKGLVEDMEGDIERIERRLERMEEDLKRQFAQLEALLSGLNTQGAFLMNQLSMWMR